MIDECRETQQMHLLSPADARLIENLRDGTTGTGRSTKDDLSTENVGGAPEELGRRARPARRIPEIFAMVHAAS